MDGSPTKPGDVVYIVNVLSMATGRQPEFNIAGAPLLYKVPLMKIVIGGAPPETDVSKVPNILRGMPATPKNKTALPQRQFTLSHGGGTGESQWLINGLEFNPLLPLAVAHRSGSGRSVERHQWWWGMGAPDAYAYGGAYCPVAFLQRKPSPG